MLNLPAADELSEIDEILAVLAAAAAERPGVREVLPSTPSGGGEVAEGEPWHAAAGLRADKAGVDLDCADLVLGVGGEVGARRIDSRDVQAGTQNIQMEPVVTASHAGAEVRETCQRGTGKPSPVPHQDAGGERPCPPTWDRRAANIEGTASDETK